MICRVCGSTDLTPVIDLGDQPWCNDFLTKDRVGKETFYPLKVLYCNKCTTTQLDTTVPKETMFGDHTYLSGVTKSLDTHFKNVCDETLDTFFRNNKKKDVSVLDIGSNDGTQLQHFKKKGCEVLGVESSVTISKMAEKAGINTVNDYFNLDLVDQINKSFDIINAAGVFFHLEELHSVTQGIKKALKKEGVFVIQFLYMKKIVDNLAFDQIYHEHLLYYNLKNVEALLERHGLEIFDCNLADIHGGSMIAFATHKGKKQATDRLIYYRQQEDVHKANDIKTYQNFAKRIEIMKEENIKYLDNAVSKGKVVYGMGAPVKGNTLLNYFGIGTNYLKYLVEKNSMRDGLYSPGMHIPIVMEDENLIPPDIYYGLAWNFKNEILKNNKDLIQNGVEFFFPVNP